MDMDRVEGQLRSSSTSSPSGRRRLVGRGERGERSPSMVYFDLYRGRTLIGRPGFRPGRRVVFPASTSAAECDQGVAVLVAIWAADWTRNPKKIQKKLVGRPTSEQPTSEIEVFDEQAFGNQGRSRGRGSTRRSATLTRLDRAPGFLESFLISAQCF